MKFCFLQSHSSSTISTYSTFIWRQSILFKKCCYIFKIQCTKITCFNKISLGFVTVLLVLYCNFIFLHGFRKKHNIPKIQWILQIFKSKLSRIYHPDSYFLFVLVVEEHQHAFKPYFETTSSSSNFYLNFEFLRNYVI